MIFATNDSLHDFVCLNSKLSGPVLRVVELIAFVVQVLKVDVGQVVEAGDDGKDVP